MKKLLAIAAITAVTGVYGQIDRSVRPAAGPAPTINIKNSQVFTLPNGITVVVSENHKLPRVSFNLVTGGTPKVEGDKAGLNQLMGQLIMSGTKNRTKDKLDNEIDYIGASLSADGSSVFLSCLTKHMNAGVDLMKDVVFNPAFPESEFNRIKKQSESSLLSVQSSPEEMSNNAERKINFPNHPNSNVMTNVTLGNITNQDVINEFNSQFTPDGAYLVIVGDITMDEAKRIALESFGSWTGTKKYTAELNGGGLIKGNRVIFINKPGAVQSVISVSFPIAIKPGQEDQIPLTVLNGILGGGGFGTRLMQNLREDKAYTYGCYSSVQITREGSWMSASGSFRNDVTDSAITQLIFEFEKISGSYVQNEELSLTKSAMAGSFARSLESPQTIARFALNIIRNKLPEDYYQNYLKRLDAVSKEEVLTMAQKYFKNGMNIIVVGDPSVLDKIAKFDTDGVIEKLDAFGNPAVEMIQADITADQLISNYVKAVTKTTSDKAAAKKLKAIKSVKQEITMSTEMAPQPLTAVDVFVAPNKEAQSLAMGKMNIQSGFYDGKKGAQTDMQNGTKELSAEEIAAKKKSYGLLPEMNYSKSGMTYSIIGIETLNGNQYYVLESNDGQTKKKDYYDKNTFLKYKTVSVSEMEGQVIESERIMDDYKEVNGIMFPHKFTQSVSGLNLAGEIKTIEVNGKIDPAMFK
jgi:predicted Zn-dependent peptidase